MDQRDGHDSQDSPVQDYIQSMTADQQALLDRLRRLIGEVRPGLAPVISYKMLCWRAGDRRLFVGAWAHGLSVYGWRQGQETAFTDRHPELKTSKGTIRLTTAAAGDLTDDDLLILVRAALAA